MKYWLSLAARVKSGAFTTAACAGTGLVCLCLVVCGLAWAQSTRHEITLPNNLPVLPEAAGRKVYQNNCVTCHSARYVLMQPKFPREVWVAEVTKMRKLYGAPISDADAETIVNYLVAIRGVEKRP